MHIEYFNNKNEKVPSVTTVLKSFYKDGLLEWSNYIGRKGINYTKFMEDKALTGSLVHEMLEADLEGREAKILTSPVKLDEAIKHVMNFEPVKKGLSISNPHTEISLSCDTYGGTLDIICNINIDGEDVSILGDFKTSKKPYLTHFIQLGAYLNLIKINKPELYEKIKYCMIFTVNIEKATVQYMSKEKCEEYFTPLFLSILNSYTMWKSLNEIASDFLITKNF